MVFLKSNIVVNEGYIPCPSKSISRQDFFNRALAFAQTNYSDELKKAREIDFYLVSAATFFKEYVEHQLSDEPNMKNIHVEMGIYGRSFWDLNNFPELENMKTRLAPFMKNLDKLPQIHKTAHVINQGIKLFGWDAYRNNFLNSAEKIIALPAMSLITANSLSQCIGNKYEGNTIPELSDLAEILEFESADQMIENYQRSCVLNPRVVGLILVIAFKTFGP